MAPAGDGQRAISMEGPTLPIIQERATEAASVFRGAANNGSKYNDSLTA